MGNLNSIIYRQLAHSVLMAHQRRSDSNCLCGVLELGDSHIDHLVDLLDTVGALRNDVPKKES
jgi:hypothetical protein